MKRTLGMLAATAALAAAPPTAATAAPSSGCPADSGSGWNLVHIATWVNTAAPAPSGSLNTGPAGGSYNDYVDMTALLGGQDGDGDGYVCLKMGRLLPGSPPWYVEGVVPISFRDDLRPA